MSKSRIMGAGNAGASKYIRLNGDVGGGNKKQGIVPLSNTSSLFKQHLKTRTYNKNRYGTSVRPHIIPSGIGSSTS